MNQEFQQEIFQADSVLINNDRNEVAYFFSNIFDTTDFPPRWQCGDWSDFHGWLYISSDIAIWLAYFIIPVILIWFVRKRPEIPFLPVFWLFSAFIILCGATHILDALIFWWPGYRLSALVRFFTAVVSFTTVFALIRDLPKALTLRGPSALRKEKIMRMEKEEENNNLIKEVAQLRDILAEKDKRIAQLSGSK